MAPSVQSTLELLQGIVALVPQTTRAPTVGQSSSGQEVEPSKDHAAPAVKKRKLFASVAREVRPNDQGGAGKQKSCCCRWTAKKDGTGPGLSEHRKSCSVYQQKYSKKNNQTNRIVKM